MGTPLSGKVAFITGARVHRRGGRSPAGARRRRRGLHLSKLGRGAQALAETINAAGGRVQAIQADAADAASLTRAVDDAARQFGKIDILVNNAGVLLLGPVDSFSLEDFDKTLAVNVRAVFVAARAALPYMGEGGRIINIGSVNADRIPFAGGSAYAMSKAALKGLVQGMARDLGPRGITVNNVQPGPTNTDMNPEHSDFATSLHGLMALQRHARPDEIAGMVAYLAGPEAGFVTGANLNIDGGFSA